MAGLSGVFGRLFGRQRGSDQQQTDTASAAPAATATAPAQQESPPMAAPMGQEPMAGSSPDDLVGVFESVVVEQVIVAPPEAEGVLADDLATGSPHDDAMAGEPLVAEEVVEQLIVVTPAEPMPTEAAPADHESMSAPGDEAKMSPEMAPQMAPQMEAEQAMPGTEAPNEPEKPSAPATPSSDNQTV